MAIESGALGRGREKSFYTWGAVAGILAVFAGFARTYYLKGIFEGPPLSSLLHLHGAVMTGWFALFLVQVRLVAGRRVGLHRRLGWFAAVWAVLVVVVGALTAIDAARRGASPGPPPLVFLAVPIGDLAVFSVFVGMGVWFRKRPDVHRRLMLLSCLGILAAAFARIPLDWIKAAGPIAFFGLTDLVILACVAYDSIRNRRLHPAFGWGAALVIASQPLRLFVGGTSAWLGFASWLVS